MPIKIYWGPPGSYKSASAVWDEVGRCAAEGRHVITNVRGMTEQLVRENAPDCALGFKLTHLNSDDVEDLYRIRTWWHWAPPGAYIMLDEVQEIYPPDWSDKKMAALDMMEERLIDGKKVPTECTLAFDKHRHGNWDLCFTTPHIRKVRPEIRMATEMAYQHKNLAVIGIKGRFMQSMHSAQDNGNPSDIYVQRMRKIPKWVFATYKSTMTGAVSDTKAGLSFLSNPRLLLALGAVAAAGTFAVSAERPSIFGGHAEQARPVDRPQAPGPGPVDSDRPSAQPRGTYAAALKPASRRLVGVVRVGLGGYAVVYRDGIESRIPVSLCLNEQYAGWTCIYEGERITTDSGQAPPEVPRYKPDQAAQPTVSG